MIRFLKHREKIVMIRPINSDNQKTENVGEETRPYMKKEIIQTPVFFYFFMTGYLNFQYKKGYRNGKNAITECF